MRFDSSGAPIAKEDQVVDYRLLIGLMDEIQLLLKLHRAGMTRGLSQNRILRRFSLITGIDLDASDAAP